MWDYRAKYLGNHDGDNATMFLDKGHDQFMNIEVRLFGVYAPELETDEGKDVQVFVADWFNKRITLSNNLGLKWPFISTTMRMKVADKEQRTFTRYVGIITATDVNDNLNSAVIQYCLTKGYGRGIGG